MLTAPESVAAAAGDLAGIGSNLGEATAAAAGSTTGLATAAEDEVSLAISRIFGGYAQEFHAAIGQAAAINSEFVSLLNGSAEAYLSTEIANAEQLLLNAMHLPAIGAAAARPTGGPYEQLIARTSTNLQSLFETWSAHPFPVLSQVIRNQQVYWQEIAAALRSAIQNFPAELANLPAAIRAAVQEFLAFDAAYYIHNIITTQIGFAQTFFGALDSAVTGVVHGLPAFANSLDAAWQAVRAGDYFGAVQDVAQGFTNLFITGFATSNEFVTVTGTFYPVFNPVLVFGADAAPLGPLAELIKIAAIPGQEAQYFTNLMPPGSIVRQMSQNFTNILVASTNPSISLNAQIPLAAPAAVVYYAFFGLPLSFAYSLAGSPIATLNALATSATSFQQAVMTGNVVGAVNALVNAPAVALDGFLNGQTIVDANVTAPTGLTPIVIPLPPPLKPIIIPVPEEISITMHLPFDGILVPMHHIQATFDLPGYPVPGFPVTVTVQGTPFGGIIPMLLNYIPEQLALAITPPK